MSEDALLNLSHDNFYALTHQAVKEMENDELFTDVTLVARGGESVKAHRIIVSVFSKAIKNILSNTSVSNPFIYFSNVDIDVLAMLKKFMYIGQCQIPSDSIEQFLKAGDDLEVEGLKNSEDNSIVIKEEASEEVDNNLVIVEENYNGNNPVESDFDDDIIDHDQNNINVVEMGEKGWFNKSEEINCLLQCPSCDHVSKSTCGLKQHVQTKHQGLRYPCEYCDYKATQRSSLKRHMKRHLESVNNKVK